MNQSYHNADYDEDEDDDGDDDGDDDEAEGDVEFRKDFLLCSEQMFREPPVRLGWLIVRDLDNSL